MDNDFVKQQKEYWENNERKNRRSPEHKTIRAFVLPKIKYIKNNILNIQDLEILDAGAGNGFFSYYFEKEFKNVISSDYSEAMLEINPAKNKVKADVTNLSFNDNKYDIVFCSNLLHHIEEPLVAVKEMARVSKKYVILHEPNRNNPLMYLFGLMKKEERMSLKFSKKYLKKLTTDANLKIIHSKTIGAVLPNKMPKFLVPVFKLFDFFPLTFYNMVIAVK